MDRDLEALEERYISLYCSNYVRESIELFSSKREKVTEYSAKHAKGPGSIKGTTAEN
jgi:hypothetical protein